MEAEYEYGGIALFDFDRGIGISNSESSVSHEEKTLNVEISWFDFN